MNRGWKHSCVAVIGIAALLTNAFASEYLGSGDWSDDRWGNSEPTGLTDTFIRTGTQTVTVTQHGEVANRLTLGQSGSQSTLTISSGSLDLVGGGDGKAPGQLYLSWSGHGETKAVLNLSGGSLTALGYGTDTNSAGDCAQLNISGTGTFHLDGHLTVGGGHADAEDSVTITGSRANIEIRKGAIFQANSTLKFTLDMYGASTLNANSFKADPTAKLVIDFGTYVYSGSGTDVVLLVDANVFATPFETTNISYLNAAELNYKLIQDPDDSGDIYVSIPEPGSYTLLGGLVGLGYVMLRRRRA